MSLDASGYLARTYSNGVILYFDRNHSIHQYLNHRLKTIRFPFHKNLLDFLAENPEIRVFFTLDDQFKPFRKDGNDYLIHMGSYIDFCRSIHQKTSGRAKAFLGHQLRITDIVISDEDKNSFIEANATEENIRRILLSLPTETASRLVEILQPTTDATSEPQSSPMTPLTPEQFINAIDNLLNNPDVQRAILNNSPKIQLDILRQNVNFLESHLEESETVIQNWLDEDEGRYRKQRCLIFGLEYIDPKREGRLNEKRFDILAEQNREHHVLIELKSPNSEIFTVRETTNQNGGIQTEYRISDELARAIPQIIGYKKWYEDASSEEIQGLGLDRKKSISKCIIVIGQNRDDQVWKDNFERLKDNLNIEIYTYTDLIDQLNNVISNLESSLTH